MDRIISDVYSTNVDPLNQDYIKKVGDLLIDVVFKELSFDGDFSNPDFDTNDLEFLKALKENTYYFVGGKYKAMKASFNDLLFDGPNLKSFSDFRKDAKAAGLIFNSEHLKTEHQLAIASAQSISDWQGYEDDDLLQYSAVMDQRTRHEHAALNGLTLPKTDKLWNSITPPLGYNCRCRLIVVPNGKKSKITATERKECKAIPDKGFNFNPATSGQLFPTNHPYLKKLTKADKEALDDML